MSDPVLASADQPASAAPAPFVPEPLPPSSFDPSKALRAVPLAFPVIHEGMTWSEIHLRRFSVAQIAVVVGNWRRQAETDPDAPLSFPIYVDQQGVEVPSALMSLLDDDDMQAVRRAGQNFLPLRFRPDPETTKDPEPAASSPNTGGATEPSSAA